MITIETLKNHLNCFRINDNVEADIIFEATITQFKFLFEEKFKSEPLMLINRETGIDFEKNHTPLAPYDKIIMEQVLIDTHLDFCINFWRLSK